MSEIISLQGKSPCNEGFEVKAQVKKKRSEHRMGLIDCSKYDPIIEKRKVLEAAKEQVLKCEACIKKEGSHKKIRNEPEKFSKVKPD